MLERQAYWNQKVKAAESGKEPKPESASLHREDLIKEMTDAANEKWDADPAHKDATAAERRDAHIQNELKARREVEAKAGGGIKASDYKNYTWTNPDTGKTESGTARIDTANGQLVGVDNQPIKAVPTSIRGAGTGGEGLEAGKPFDILDKNGKVVQSGVQLREGKSEAGYVHAEDGSPLVLKPGEHVKQTSTSASTGGRVAGQAVRQTAAGHEVITDLANVVRLPFGTTLGTLATVHPGSSIFGAVQSRMTRGITSNEAKFMEASLSGLKRELSMLMSPVYGGAWASEQLNGMIPVAGDGQGLALFKIARMAQTADNALIAMENSSIFNPQQHDEIVQMRKDIRDIIPYTPANVYDFYHTGRHSMSFGEYVTSHEVQYALPNWADKVKQDDSGRKIYHGRDGGGWFNDDHTRFVVPVMPDVPLDDQPAGQPQAAPPQ
jgi:hypothetical protein